MRFKKKSSIKGYYGDTKVELLSAGQRYFDLLVSLINKAEKSIHLQVYILGDDETGNMIMDALIEAHKRGVEVFVLVDSVGSFAFGNNKANWLSENGIKFRFFSPIISGTGIHFGRRLHRKVLVVDGHTAVVGGINIADRWRIDKGQEKLWLDYAVFVQGDIALEIENICMETCYRKFSKILRIKRPDLGLKYFQNFTPLVRVRENDYSRNKRSITRSYKYVFRNAENSITIAHAYFLPGPFLMNLIKNAIRRGVAINLVLSKETDTPLFKPATSYLYRKFLKMGINIFEYIPSVVHAKVAVVDSMWSTVGSHDINTLSTLGLVEMNLDIIDSNFAYELQNRLDNIMQNDCVKVMDEQTQKSVWQRTKEWFAYHTLRLVMGILVSLNNKIE